MPPKTRIVHALVLKAYETGESSEVLHLLTAEDGRLSAYANGLRSPKNRLRGIVQPLALVEATLQQRDGSGLATLRDATLIESHAGVTGDLERLALAMLLAEAAAGGCEEGHAAPEVFAALLEGIHQLDPRSALSAPTAMCASFAHLLGILGFDPQISPELTQPWGNRPKPLCFWLHIEEGFIHARGPQPADAPAWPVATRPGHREVALPPQAVRFLFEFSSGMVTELSPSHAWQLLEGMVRLAEYHFERPLKSADFWRSIVGVR